MAHLVRWRSGRHLLFLYLAASGQHLIRAANEGHRIDAQRPANQGKYHNCTNANAAGTTGRQAATIFNTIACR